MINILSIKIVFVEKIIKKRPFDRNSEHALQVGSNSDKFIVICGGEELDKCPPSGEHES